MNVLNELFGAIKIVKFFAWGNVLPPSQPLYDARSNETIPEQHWITRVLSARSSELNLLRKAANNGILARLLWSLTPILVSLVSFATFVSLGNTLDVATAFTALTLFDMIRLPLNTIPAFTTQVLQTGVSVKRIEEFLKEDEVDEEVSALKESSTAPQSVAENDGLGFENAYFRWNSTASHQPPVSAQAYDDDEEQDSRFELRNLNIKFPERALTVVTGPTASGKTALLVSSFFYFFRLDD
jgi:ABC-type multidrug transport system fused ATPase/permease subunit